MMHRPSFGAVSAAVLLLAALSQPARAQQAAGTGQTAPVTVLRTSTQLVVLDVVVQDHNGRPVRGLGRDIFHVEEKGQPQRIRSFDEHTSADAPTPGPPAPKLPAGTFTNYTPVPAGGPLNILLVDALNTPLSDQNYLRLQLQKYVRTMKPGATIAIFGLNSRLVMLQGFTSDPVVLKEALNRKDLTRGSTLLADPNGSNVDSQQASDLYADLGPGLDDIVANLQQFEAEQASQSTQFRAQFTLDAMDELAHYLANFPGRKNLIWFSGAFPINLLPDPSINNGFDTQHLNEVEFRETSSLLTHAQVAVYPVDARGLATNPMFAASSAGQKYATPGTAFGKDLNKFNANQAAAQTTMDQMASDTGGHAFLNTNGLADAVTAAIDSGSNFYTLTYSPSEHGPAGQFRPIHVELSGPAAAAGLTLAYRHGYYTDPATDTGYTTEAASPATAKDPKAEAAAAYTRVAMSHGSPAPESILFQVSVVPLSTAPEDKLALGNRTDPAAPLHGPFRRYAVNYAALPDAFTFSAQPNGHHVGVIGFRAYVYNPEGKLLNEAVRAIRLDLPPAQYSSLMAAGVGMRLEVSVPDAGESYLRIGVEDEPSNRLGVVEISTRKLPRLASSAPPGPATPR